MEGGQHLATGLKKKKGIFFFLRYDRISLKSRLRKKTLPEDTCCQHVVSMEGSEGLEERP